MVYLLAVTGAAQVTRDGLVVGSELNAQSFKSPGYFQPRPSAAGDVLLLNLGLDERFGRPSGGAGATPPQ